MEQDHKVITVERPTGPRITASEPKSIGQLVSIRARTVSKSVVSSTVAVAAATLAVLTKHKFATGIGASFITAGATHLIMSIMMMGIIINAPAGSSTAFSLSLSATGHTEGSATVFNLGSQSTGTGDSTLQVIVSVSSQGGGTHTGTIPSGVTVGGNALTLVPSSNVEGIGQSGASQWICASSCTAGGSQNVTITFASNSFRIEWGVYALYGSGSTVQQVVTDAPALSATVSGTLNPGTSKFSAVVAATGGTSFDCGGAANFTIDHSTSFAGALCMVVGSNVTSLTTSTTLTQSWNGSQVDNAGSFVAYGPP